MGNSSNLHLFEDALYEHQGSFEALGEQLAPGERQLVIRFMEDLLRLRSERSEFFFDGKNGDGIEVPDIFGGGGGKNWATLTSLPVRLGRKSQGVVRKIGFETLEEFG